MEEVNRNIATIFQQNIPSGKKALQDSHKNLSEIADYCERQYVSVNNTYKSNDKIKALEETRVVFAETKQYATQSLASVAYQIHALAASVLDLLDNQASQFSQMNSDISYISNVSKFYILFKCLIIHMPQLLHVYIFNIYGTDFILSYEILNINLKLQ